MKVYTKRSGRHYDVVVFVGIRVFVKMQVMGQDLGKTIVDITNGEAYERLDALPDGIKLTNGVVSWRNPL